MRGCWLVGVGIAIVVGCSPAGPKAEVLGTVKLDGQAIGPGWIEFISADRKMSAGGTINADGSYTLVSNPKAKLGPGKFQVSVSVREQPASVNPGDRPPPGKSRIPEKYEQGETSGLEYEVAAGQNTIDVELTSGP